MASNTFVKHISVGHGIALYVSAILGAGVLVLPGQVASMAGPASLVSWTVAILLGIPLASMFAILARQYPDAGGIASYAAAGFGPRIGAITGWLFFVAGSIGQTIVPLTGGYYVADALGAGPATSFAVAAIILAAATAANLLGVRVSGRAQLALAGAVALALAITIALTVPRMSTDNLTPFAPNGLAPIGSGIIVLFFAFAGWEAISHLAGEFHDSDRDVPRAVAATVVIVSVLYLGTACAVVLTGTYGRPETDRVAIGILLRDALGSAATPVAAVIAVVISLGTTNAFIAGVSRLASSLAADHWLPKPVARITRTGVPVGGVVAVAGTAAAGLAVAASRGWGTDTLVVVPSTLVVVVYVIAAASAVRILTGWGRATGLLTLTITAIIVPTALQQILIPIVVVALALASRALCRPRKTRAEPKEHHHP